MGSRIQKCLRDKEKMLSVGHKICLLFILTTFGLLPETIGVSAGIIIVVVVPGGLEEG